MKISWRMKFGLALVVLTVALLTLHSVVFRGSEFEELGLFLGTHEIAMMPLEVLVVTMIFHSLLERQAHQEKMHKMNMVIGAFFSEVGSPLLRRVSALDEADDARGHFLVQSTWDAQRYEAAKKATTAHDYRLEATGGQLEELKSFLSQKRSFLLGLLENPSLLEHETFTDALWAVFHLTEELEQRPSLEDLPPSDHLHLIGDIKRAYATTAAEWLDHARHLQKQYPYLFSLALRTNPLDPSASVTVTA